MDAPTLRDETLAGETHQYRTGSPAKCAEMTEKPHQLLGDRPRCCMDSVQQIKIFAPKPHSVSTLTTSHIRQLLNGGVNR